MPDPTTSPFADDALWAPFSHEAPGPVGVLISHGFTGGPASVMPLAQGLAAAGLSVECPRLPGHGPRWRDLAAVTAEAWVRELEAALARLRARCPAVFVVGLSMGGTLALRLAADHPDLRGVVAINPALWFRSPLMPFAGWLKGLLPSTPSIASDIRIPGVVEPACDRTPTAGVAELYRLARHVRRDLPKVKQPLLLLQSRVDHVLPARNGPRLMRAVGSADAAHVWLERSYHVATLDGDADLILNHCLAFVHRLAESP